MYFYIFFLILAFYPSINVAMHHPQQNYSKSSDHHHKTKKHHRRRKKSSAHNKNNVPPVNPHFPATFAPGKILKEHEFTQEEVLEYQDKELYKEYVYRISDILHSLNPQEIPYKLRVAADRLDVEFVKLLMSHKNASPYFDAMGRYNALDVLDDKEYETCLKIYAAQLPHLPQTSEPSLYKILTKEEKDGYATMQSILEIRSLLLQWPRLDVPINSIYKKQLSYFNELILKDAKEGRISPLEIATYFLKATIAFDKEFMKELMKYPGAPLARYAAWTEINKTLKKTNYDLQTIKDPGINSHEKYSNYKEKLQNRARKAETVRLLITYWDFKPPRLGIE